MTTLTAVYDALIAGDIPSEKATAAVEAIEVARDEPWKRKMEAAHADIHTEIGQIKVMLRIIIVMLVPMLIKLFWEG